jgi:16S rRNA G966 N2-methylase RsmD
MLSNVLNLIETGNTNSHNSVEYEKFGKISGWAQAALVRVANKGILDMLAGSESLQSETLSKSEAAMAIEKMLQQADLINK